MQKILVGAGVELRFRLAPIDDHDRVLVSRQDRRSNRQKMAAEARHAHNVEEFRANAKKR